MGVFTLQQSMNFAGPYVDYIPLNAGLGGEPAVSIGTMIKNTMMSAPFGWEWNRGYDTSLTLVVGQQDYALANNNLSYLEKASLTDPDTLDVKEIGNVLNEWSLAAASSTSPLQRPDNIAIKNSVFGTGPNLRFMGVPDKTYALNLVYQQALAPMGPFFLSAVGNASAGSTTYTGIFDVNSFPVNAIATITGFTNAVNNGNFVVVSCSSTSLVVSNASGVAATQSGYASNQSWFPIPDSYNSIYNTLFLGEIMSYVDHPSAQIYRQRGAAALLAKADGLNEMQKNIFMQQWLARGAEQLGYQQRTQLGNQARGV